MKLSDAMRLGQAIRPRQLVGKLFDGEDGACAMGVAVLGSGQISQEDAVIFDPLVLSIASRNFRSLFPWITYFIAAEIITRNNKRGQSIEQIAAWLDTIDPEAIAEKAAQAAEEVPHEVCA